MLTIIVSVACLIWYAAVILVCGIGYTQIYRFYSRRQSKAVSESLKHDDIPHVTIIRPVKGLEPELYHCLASTYQQSYPKDKLTIYLCISSRNDPALPVLEQVVGDFREYDTKILIEDEDPALNSEDSPNFGPNPKIRNMSRAYREAKGDIVWIIDCNVWVGRGVAGRMVDTLCGFGRSMKYKFVHQLPLVVDVTNRPNSRTNEGQQYSSVQAVSTSTLESECVSHQRLTESGTLARISQLGGTRLEEMFLSSSHAKFYTAINTVLIAPCIVGKSNMFRRSHLDFLTSHTDDEYSRPPGIDYFSHNICEDHLIGDLLWKNDVPEESETPFGKHALVFGDLAIQPMASMSISEYVARRVRWLRVRKFTVLAATLVEPGTESFLCSVYGAFGATNLPWMNETFGIPQTWSAFLILWLTSVTIWAIVDWTLFRLLHSMASIEVDENTPTFARGNRKKSLLEWLVAWLGREALALPIWLCAVYGGVTVVWRGRRFRVSLDARVRAIDDDDEHIAHTSRQIGSRSSLLPVTANGHTKSRNE